MKRKCTLEDFGFIKTRRVDRKYEINDLPTELIIMIFKFLTPSQRRNMITVNHRWLNIVNNYFPEDHCLFLTATPDYSPSGSIYQIFNNRLTTSKHLRSFSRLIVEQEPDDSESYFKFLDLIGHEIKDLQIKELDYGLDDDYIQTFYSKFPIIKTLEVEGDEVLKNVPSNTRVHTIKMVSTLYYLEHFIHLREIKTIKSLSINRLRISKDDMENVGLRSFMQTDAIKVLKSFIGNTPRDGSITLKSDFNYGGTEKMSLNEIEEIRMDNCVTPLSPNTFDKFKKLKRISFYIGFHQPDFILMAERAKYSGITHLSFAGDVFWDSRNSENLLQSFPDLEYLSFYNFVLNDLYFSTICGYMPKLKELVLKGYRSNVTVDALFTKYDFSLKDLKFLECLDIKTTDEPSYSVNYLHWPSLPYLKKLSLVGQNFQQFNQNFYSQIATKSPNITHVKIMYANEEGIENDVEKFIPLLRDLKITHLKLPGNVSTNDDRDDVRPNAALINIIVANCKHLQVLSLTDKMGFSLSEELLLFKSLPSLESIFSFLQCSTGTSHKLREITRKDSKNLIPYLKENLHSYNKLWKNLEYITKNIIPANQYKIFYDSYTTENEDVDDMFQIYLYIVTTDFLKMDNNGLCKILSQNLMRLD